MSARLLLVEDDDPGVWPVEELLADVSEPFTIVRARSMAEAKRAANGVECVLLDLELPDASGLEALSMLREGNIDAAVVVLTSVADRGRGSEAVAAGAHDCLVRGEVDGHGLATAIRYAIDRRRAQRVAQQLLVSEHRQAQNDLLARALLPTLRLDAPCAIATRYQPGASTLLCGDFFDAVARPAGLARVVIGDVSGHGPLEAALGVALRIAWRTMTAAGATADETLAAVEAVLRMEREREADFATLCDLTIDVGTRQVEVRSYGHPPPLLIGDEVTWWSVDAAPPIGSSGHRDAVKSVFDLPDGCTLLLVTDGIYEGRYRGGRLGMDQFRQHVADLHADQISGAPLLDRLVATATKWHGGPLDDDVALLLFGLDGALRTSNECDE